MRYTRTSTHGVPVAISTRLFFFSDVFPLIHRRATTFNEELLCLLQVDDRPYFVEVLSQERKLVYVCEREESKRRPDGRG